MLRGASPTMPIFMGGGQIGATVNELLQAKGFAVIQSLRLPDYRPGHPTLWSLIAQYQTSRLMSTAEAVKPAGSLAVGVHQCR